MRVLLPVIWHSLTHCIERAFQDMGHETRVVDWRHGFKEKRRGDVEPMCIKAAQEFKPDLCFAQFQTHGVISPKFPQVLTDLGCFSIQWSGDVRHPLPDHYIDLAPYFDVTSFSNGTDVELIRAKGYRSEFLQIGYDATVFNTEGAGERSGVVFLGNNYGDYKFAESASRRTMVQAMAEAFPDDFKVYGTAWEGVVPPKNLGGYLHEPDSPDVLRRALVAVGYDHFHRPGFASDRLLRATACGCATVNQHYEGIEVEHPYVGAAHSIEDMVRMVRYALANPEASKVVGRQASEWTNEHHQWTQRVKQIEAWMV